MAKSDKARTVYALTAIRPSDCPPELPQGYPRGSAVTLPTSEEADFFVNTGAAQREPVEEPKSLIPGEPPVVVPAPVVNPEVEPVLSPNRHPQPEKAVAQARKETAQVVEQAQADGATAVTVPEATLPPSAA